MFIAANVLLSCKKLLWNVSHLTTDYLVHIKQLNTNNNYGQDDISYERVISIPMRAQCSFQLFCCKVINIYRSPLWLPVTNL